MNDLAVYNQKKEEIISSYGSNTLNAVVQIDHVADLLNSPAYSEAGKAFAGYVSNAVTLKYQEHFHKNLNFLEKMNFMSQTKKIAYERNCTRFKTGTELGIGILLETGPLLYRIISNQVNKTNLENFFVNWMGYINHGQPLTTMMKINLQKLYRSMGLSFNDDKVTVSVNHIGNVIPKLNGHNFKMLNSAEQDQIMAMAKTILSPFDMKNEKTKERATEFLCDFLDMGYSEAVGKLDDVMAAQEHLSQFLMFTSIDYVGFFNKFIATAHDAVQFGKYNVENDCYAQLRQRNQQHIIEIAKNVIDMKDNVAQAIAKEDPSLLEKNKDIKFDIVRIANDMMSETLQPKREQTMEFVDTVIERNEAYQLENDEEE